MGTHKEDTRKRVLILTQYEHTGGVLGHLVARFGYEPVHEADGKLALALIRTRRPDCLISEFLVPGIGALDLLGAAREADARLPVLFLVPGSDAAAENTCLAYGASGCIIKPIQAEDLYAALQAVLEPRPRASIRIATVLPVRVNNRAVSTGSGSAIELSEQGMYLPFEGPRPAGSMTITLQFSDRAISVDAAVLYSLGAASGTHRGPGVGVKFLSLSPPDREFLRHYIREEVTSH